MILVVDSSALALLINLDATPPNDPATGKPVASTRDRIEHFLGGMGSRDTIIIPTPVLAEILVKAGDGAPGVLAYLDGLARIRVRSFDQRAAVETALMTRDALQAGNKRGFSLAPWQKVKIDRQIIAIARVSGATRIYTDDHDMITFAHSLSMDVISTWDLVVPESVSDLFTVAGMSSGGIGPSSDDELLAPSL